MQNNNEWSRRAFMKSSALVAAAGIAAPLLTSCAGSTTGSSGSENGLDRLKKQGFVNVGIWGSLVYGFTDKNGRVTGEQPEVARAVFSRLGVPEVKATQVAFEQLIPALNAGQFDMICGGLYITPERCQNALFSRPDFTVNDAMLVPKGNPLNVKTLEDVAREHVKIVIQPSTPEKTWALATGVKEENMVSLDSNQALLEAVATGRAYAGILSDLSMKSLIAQNPDAPVEISNVFQPLINGKPALIGASFLFRQGDQQLVDAFNREHEAIQDNGEWLKTVEPFGFTKENLPPKDLTTEKLCASS